MSRNTPPVGFQRLPRIADQMTPDLLACVARGIAAERAGDLQAALEWHSAIPMFRRGRHLAMLERLTACGEDLPDRVWARWIAYLATRCDNGETGAIVKALATDLLNTAHGDLVDDCYDDGSDPVRVAAIVVGESWLYHQILVHEAGGLECFIDEHLTGRLLERAELARSWAGARMSGYEVGPSLPGARLQVREAGQDDGWAEVLDLGARSCTDGGWVLGRLVPSGVDDLLMFDVPPMGVAAELAREFATADDWAPVVRELAAGMPSRRFLREDYELLTDVQDLDLIEFGTAPGDLERVLGQLRSGRDEGSRAAYRILRRARDGEIDPGDQAYVAAAALLPHALGDARRQLVRPGEYDVWAGWAERVTSPARGRLMALAEAARAAA